MAGMAATNDRLISSEHAAVDQVSTAATEMSAAVHEVAQNAPSASDAARDAESQSRKGAAVVGSTIESIRQLAQEVESTSQTIEALADETASIGRRYARQDEAGTPFGITIDFETLGEKGPELQDTVTLRHRDTNEQERVKIADLLPRLLAAVS